MQHIKRFLFAAFMVAGCSSSTNPPLDRGEVVFRGAHPAEMAGISIGHGDFNGDGQSDLLIGAASRDATHAGRAYVVFGPIVEGEQVLDVAAGMSVIGAADGQTIARDVHGVGDTNGDGLHDFLVSEQITCTVPEGCYEGCPTTCSGGLNRVYLVYGRADGGHLALKEATNTGAAIATHDEASDELAAQRFAALGDLNGDGLADFAIAAGSANAWEGRVYVVFGAAAPSSIDFAAIAAGQGGYIVEPEPGGNSGFGRSLAAGDINGDGLSDLVIGANTADENRGRAYVVFGKSDTAAIFASDVVAGVGGFVMQAEDNEGPTVCCSETGLAVASGDVNADGRDDVVVSAPFLDVGGELHSGRTYVVFGKNDGAPVQLADIAAGSGGFALDGNKFSKIGFSLAAVATDHDGDGRADVLLDDADAEVYIAAGKVDGLKLGIADLARPELTTPGTWYLADGSALGLFNANDAADIALRNAQFEGDEAGAVLLLLR